MLCLLVESVHVTSREPHAELLSAEDSLAGRRSERLSSESWLRVFSKEQGRKMLVEGWPEEEDAKMCEVKLSSSSGSWVKRRRLLGGQFI